MHAAVGDVPVRSLIRYLPLGVEALAGWLECLRFWMDGHMALPILSINIQRTRTAEDNYGTTGILFRFS